jgi:ATP-dependent helicase Lhr and Lhr-like helicase
LREVRRQPDAEDWAVVSGSDPLNLAGILTPGPKLASLAGNRLVYRSGVPVAALAAGEVTFYLELDPDSEWQARELLLGGTLQAPSLAPEIGTGGDRKFAHTRQ